MKRNHRVAHGPVVRLLCVACVSTGGLLCLGFTAILPWVIAVDGEGPAPEDWLDGLGDWWPFAVVLAGAGFLQLAIAGWGVWAWPSVERAG